jgi:hypothetical protein
LDYEVPTKGQPRKQQRVKLNITTQQWVRRNGQVLWEENKKT